jgi:aromatic-amino-acid transaminase
MFETLRRAEPDKIMEQFGLFRADTRPRKVDLGIGVYKDATGNTPVMAAVREAEKRLCATQTTKSYLGIAGDVAFNAAMMKLVFGADADLSRIRAVQAPGGSGALRFVAELLKIARPDAVVWLPDPTWPNHVALIGTAGVAFREYPYFDEKTGNVRFDAMMAALRTAQPGDVVLLHACCHNPTGADLNLSQWSSVADLVVDHGLVPFVDIAYQGFGDGLDEDAAGLRMLAARVPEMAVASTCSKSFSVYRERTGAALLMGRTSAEADLAFGQLLNVARAMCSMPPDHGAVVVRTVIEDASLREIWRAELDAMRARMVSLRRDFTDALRRQSNSDRFDFLVRHRGMFSRTGLTPDQVRTLRDEHAIYLIEDSRMNVAGLPEQRLDEIAAAIVTVTA